MRTEHEVLMPTERELQLFQAALLLSHGRLPLRADATFVYGRAAGDNDNLLEMAAELVLSGRVADIVLTGTEGEGIGPTASRAWAGKTAWTEKLMGLGVDPRHIMSSGPAYHTRQESDAYVAVAQAHGWERAISISQPHQVLRAMLGMVKSLQNAGNISLRVYAWSPPQTNWEKVVHGSQGQTPMPRFGHIQPELERVVRYQAAGDLATFEELLAYLRMRDS